MWGEMLQRDVIVSCNYLDLHICDAIFWAYVYVTFLKGYQAWCKGVYD